MRNPKQKKRRPWRGSGKVQQIPPTPATQLGTIVTKSLRQNPLSPRPSSHLAVWQGGGGLRVADHLPGPLSYLPGHC